MATNDSGDAGKGQGDTRQCNLLQLYIKDVSFESPGVPGVLFGHEQPALQFDVSSTYKLSAEASAKLGEVYAVLVRVTVQAAAGDKTLFLIEVEQGGLFELHGYAEDEKDFALRTRAPELLYPYVRELVASLVSRSGFPRLQLRPINFEGRYSQSMKEYYEAAAKMAEAAASQA
ncbi:MAG: protein-export chaperone SecB [Gammaproteobacteria bacterium]|nr:protein-export chaperone SecB [Gammaproteobacteria bacterium]